MQTIMNDHLPEPRSGLLGEWDKFVGPGQTRPEFWLIMLPAIAGGLALLCYARWQGLPWSFWQYLVGMLLAFDLVGGVATNATATAKRWYHRPGQTWRQHLGFIAVHAIQLFLVTWLFRNLDWAYFGAFYAYLLAASLMIIFSPLNLQRPVALLLVIGAVLLEDYGFPATRGMEWFVTVFFIKLLVSHLLKEA
ncbi:MAG: hypothetical protein ACOYYS_00525 [Chloroflexota bacterium]